MSRYLETVLALARMIPSINGKDLPDAWYSLEFLLPLIPELDTRSNDQILDGSQDEHLAGIGQRADPGCDVHGYAPKVVASNNALASMQSGPQLHPEAPRGFEN